VRTGTGLGSDRFDAVAHVLDFLRAALKDGPPKGTPQSEYRLLCSGELFNEKVLTANYQKTDAARFLMRGPFDLMVCSHRYDDYPQELALSIAVEQVQEGGGSLTVSHRPDDEVARDIAALLSVYTRRLITVAGKVRTRWPDGIEGLEPRRDEWPAPIVGRIRAVAWPKRPATVSHGPEGTTLRDYAPPARAVDPGDLLMFLRGLSSMPKADTYAASARSYAAALEQIEERPEAAYQLLITSVEALANEEYENWPPDEEKIREKKRVSERAQKMGLSEQQGRELALLACEGMNWVRRKFVRLITECVSENVWGPDELFEVPPMLVPAREQLEEAVNAIYRQRGKALHGAHAYPASAGCVAGPWIPVAAVHELLTGQVTVPPVPWFERLANSVLTAYVRRNAAAPAAE